MDQQLLDKIRTRVSRLSSDRSSWDSHWQELAQFLMPRSGRFGGAKRNDGARKHNSIYDSSGLKALRTLSAGMMAGMTSPARPWFKLSTLDPELAEYDSVKEWLSDVRRLLLEIFNRSNTYRALHTTYRELGGFGTSVSFVSSAFDTVIHHNSIPLGEFSLTVDDRDRVSGLYREYAMTAGQMVSKFGIKRVSQSVAEAVRDGNIDNWFPVCHVVEPRADRDLSKVDNLNMPWRSIYFEPGEKTKVLEESGFKRFRALAPRWDIETGDVYGNSPGMEALGDVKQLQHEQLRKAQAIDKQIDPPLQVPTSLKNKTVDSLPGGVTYVDAASQHSGIRSMFEVNLNMDHLLLDINDVRRRIESCFYADLFLMLQSAPPNSRMTATEVAERHEEKLLMLGPVLERLHHELLSPLVSLAFEDALAAGLIPPPPPEMEGQELNVVFVSVLAQAQRAIETNSIDRFVGNLGALAQLKPDVLDKLDSDKWADVYSDMLGVDPELIIPTDKVALIRQQRAAAMQQQAQATQQAQQAATMKDLSQANTGGQNALNEIMRNISGYTP